MFVQYGCGVCCIATDACATNACATDACGNDTCLSDIYVVMYDCWVCVV